MTGYFVRRFLLIIPTFIGITLLVFAITRVVPGGPIERLMTQIQLGGETGSLERSQGGGTLSDEQMEELKRYYGFDKPMLSSYAIWLKKVLQFDLGLSTRYQDPVWQIIKERFPISIYYGLTTLILTYAVCIPLGLAKGMYHGSALDSWSSAVVFLGYALPSYVIGIALISMFAGYWDIFPLGGFISDNYDELTLWGKASDIFSHSVLPLIAYLAGSFAVTTLMMKNSLMDNLSADYMRTATAKGLSRSESVRGHALRNSLIPVATSFGSNISLLLGGSFLIETIFNIDGIGLLGYEAIIERDYPIVMGILVISSLLYLLGNILSDICVALVDPRIRFGERSGS
ncbi:ABC transporter permease subunit [Zhongshania sp. BJYM1]|uniref:ABC transporter permease subunit n=1 Tax=Zhongshania aquatica TaxID=2965069 RepID=UPI0022B57012|nr:ABC transporter permease subunit [Marortus sp. BJYM1]